MAQPLQADPPPQNVSFEELTLNIKAPDINSISLHFSRGEIVNNNGKITIEIPAGSQRTFEVVAGNGGESRIYGGIRTVDLAPGQQVNLEIEMGELFQILGTYSVIYNQTNKQLTITAYKEYNPVAFKIVKIYGNGWTVPYTTRTDFNKGNDYTYTIQDLELTTSSEYDYYVKGVNQYGESSYFHISF